MVWKRVHTCQLKFSCQQCVFNCNFGKWQFFQPDTDASVIKRNKWLTLFPKAGLIDSAWLIGTHFEFFRNYPVRWVSLLPFLSTHHLHFLESVDFAWNRTVNINKVMQKGQRSSLLKKWNVKIIGGWFPECLNVLWRRNVVVRPTPFFRHKVQLFINREWC